MICGVAPATAAPSRPNIVVFLSDDHSQLDSTVYGAKDVRTPNMQRLAAAGLTFTNAFVASPSCAPSRAALLTGLMPARNGAEANHSKARAEIRKLPAVFAELGYEVVAFGKVAHYGHAKDYGFEQSAFDAFHDHRGIAAAVELLTKRDAATAKPLCLFVGTHWPHVPWPEQADGYDPAAITIPPTHIDTPETRLFRARYYAAITQSDRDLGIVYDAARERLGRNTIFLHSSDNGAQWPFAKWTLYDAGIRAPLMVEWPGVIEPASRTDACVSWVDILPTLIEAAGGKPPASLDGRSFLPVLRGEKREHRDRIFTTHSGDGSMNVYPMRSVRTPQWKYILNLHPEFAFTTHIDRAQNVDGAHYWRSWERAALSSPHAAAIVKRYRERPAEELYNLANDPFEQDNLATDPAEAERRKSMRSELESWMKAQGDEGKVFNKPVLLSEVTRPQRDRPHIIVILTDDLGSGDLSCYGGTARTPNIDRIAHEGIRFTQYYSAAPICSPSRAGLLTGIFPARWRLTSYLQTRAGNRGCEQADYLDPKAPTIPRRLKSVGYATAHFGKWHLGGGRDVNDAPKFAAYGYDEHASTYESPEPHPDLTATNWVWSPKDKVKRWERTAFFVDKTIDFLRRHEEPCFINLWLDDPHTPWVPGANAPKGNTQENLRAVLAETDVQIGRLLDGLRTLGIEQKTLVIFTSDNGPLPTFAGARNAGLRGSKLSLYEAGIRVPFLVRWPGTIPAGRIDEETVLGAVDLFPTLAAIAGAELPPGVEFDGENMDAAFRGTPTVRRSPLFWEYGRNEGQWFKFPPAAEDRSPNVAVRENRWKLLINADGTRAELYDVVADRPEQKNVAAEHPEIVDRLSSRALAWRRSLPAPLAPAPTDR